jgi:hypothetical protein
MGKQSWYFRVFMIICGLCAAICGVTVGISAFVFPDQVINLGLIAGIGLLSAVGGFVILIEKAYGQNL